MTEIGTLAFHKNASNVIEKLICAADGRRMTPAQLSAFYARLLHDSGNRAEPGPLLDRLISHQYGNYIVNSCIAVRRPFPRLPEASVRLAARLHCQDML